MTIGGSILSGMLWGVPLLGVPACVIVFALVVLGRRLGGRRGMQAGAVLAVLLAASPLLWTIATYAGILARGGSLTALEPELSRGFFILGEGLTALGFALAALWVMWGNQARQASD